MGEMGTGSTIPPSHCVLGAACGLGTMSMCRGRLGSLQSWLGRADGTLSNGTPYARMAPNVLMGHLTV